MNKIKDTICGGDPGILRFLKPFVLYFATSTMLFVVLSAMLENNVITFLQDQLLLLMGANLSFTIVECGLAALLSFFLYWATGVQCKVIIGRKIEFTEYLRSWWYFSMLGGPIWFAMHKTVWMLLPKGLSVELKYLAISVPLGLLQFLIYRWSVNYVLRSNTLNSQETK